MVTCLARLRTEKCRVSYQLVKASEHELVRNGPCRNIAALPIANVAVNRQLFVCSTGC